MDKVRDMRLAILFLILATACTGIIDMGSGDLPPATDVQVVIRDGQSPQAGVTVIFQDLYGTVLSEVTTDDRGVAALEMAEGNVTVIRSYPTPVGQDPLPTEVYTYAGVKAGDRLQLGRATSEQGNPSAVLVKVPENARGTIKILAPCGAGQGTGPLVAITVRDCAPEIGIYVEDGDRLSFFKRTAFSENIDVSLEPLQDALGSTVSATNILPNTTVTVEQRLGSGGFDFYSTGAKRVDQAPANVTMPPLSGVEHLVIASISSNGRTQLVGTRKTFTQDTPIVDASVGLIAAVTELKYAQTGITWVEEGTGTPDAVIASLNVTRPDTATDREYVRMIIAPHAGAALQVPVLGGSAAIYNPTKDDQVGTALGLAKITGGYDAIRGRAFAVESLVDATPMDGQLTLSYTGTRPGL